MCINTFPGDQLHNFMYVHLDIMFIFSYVVPSRKLAAPIDSTISKKIRAWLFSSTFHVLCYTFARSIQVFLLLSIKTNDVQFIVQLKCRL